MCHHTHINVMLSAEEKKEVKKLAGALIPAYASILLGLLVFATVSGGPRESEMVASTSTSAAPR